MKPLQRILAAFLLVPCIASTAWADDHDRHHRDRDRDRAEWHGEIGRFHEHDLDRWRGGRWYHGHHDGRLGWWWIVGGLWYFYPARVEPYPDPYQPPVVVVPPPAAPAPPQYWYYCPKPAGYYPYVPRCAVNWQRVEATPAPGLAPPR
jgi:hypothetical protein